MARLGGRVLKMELVARSARAVRRESSRELLRLIAEGEVRERPELELVGPGDADPATYRGIQSTLALARGEFERAGELEARRPTRERGPNLTGNADRDVVLMADWMNRVLVPGIHARIEREGRAVARAGARAQRAAGGVTPAAAGERHARARRRGGRGTPRS